MTTQVLDVDDFSQFFKGRKKFANLITDVISDIYSWSTSLNPVADNLPTPFVSQDNEVVWSYLKHQNKQLDCIHRKYRGFLGEMVGKDEIEIEKNVSEEDEDMEEDFEDEEIEDEELEDEEFDDDDVDLFNLKEEDLKNLDRDLKEMQDESDSGIDENGPRKAKKYKKSIVDDAFFKLDEMNDFLEKTERNTATDTNLFDEDESWDGKTNYTYEDFFGSRDEVDEGLGDPKKKGIPKKRKAMDDGPENDDKEKKKRVRFAIDEEEDEEDIEDEAEDEEKVEEDIDHPVLLGAKLENEKEESAYQKRQNKMKERIAKLEEENLAPKSWELSGEIAADHREKDTLLEQHLEFDHGSKRAPEVTEEFTDKLEELIKQRIRDNAFDDVVRTKKIEGKGPYFESAPIEEIYNQKTSLAEVYEKDYQKSTGTDGGEKNVVNESHEMIKSKMKDLFGLIDALTHFEYKPAEAKEDVKIVNNMASLRVEEVGAMASSEAQLMAPEEVAKKVKGIEKADEERDRTDKLRARRKKKAKQRALVEKFGEERVFGEQKALKMKKKEGVKEKVEKIKSSNFFSKLQDTVQQEKREGVKTKKKVIKREKTDKNSSAIKL